MRILIAEDDAIWANLLERLLESAGYEIVPAQNGFQALAIMSRDDAPHMAILDWQMPGLTGPELTTRLRELPREFPPYLIILTARNQPADIVAGLEAGADDYLTKPFHKAELLARLKAGRRVIEAQLQLAESRRQLQWQAEHDPLTGIWNRRAILDHLARELDRCQREGGLVTAGLIDVDGFKRINDTCGHQTGDAVLQTVIQSILHCLRPYDHLGRLGGDELLVVAPMTDNASPEALFERLRLAVRSSQLPSGQLSPPTVSIGWAATSGSHSPDQLLRLADSALYAAKRLGRDRVVASMDDISSYASLTR